jgi:hypothetical protein
MHENEPFRGNFWQQNGSELALQFTPIRLSFTPIRSRHLSAVEILQKFFSCSAAIRCQFLKTIAFDFFDSFLIAAGNQTEFCSGRSLFEQRIAILTFGLTNRTAHIEKPEN